MAFWSGLAQLLGVDEEDFWSRVEYASDQVDQLFAPLDSIFFASPSSETSSLSPTVESPAESSCSPLEVPVCSEAVRLSQTDSESSIADADLESSVSDADIEGSVLGTSSDLEAPRSAPSQAVQHALCNQSWFQEGPFCAGVSSLPQTGSESSISDADHEGFISDADSEGSASDADLGGAVSDADLEGSVSDADIEGSLSDADIEGSLSDADFEGSVSDVDSKGPVSNTSLDSGAEGSARFQVVQHALCRQSLRGQEGPEQDQQQSDTQDVFSSCGDLASEVEGVPEKCEALALVCRQGLCSTSERTPQNKETEQEDKTSRAALDQGTTSVDASVQLDWGCLTQIMSHLDNRSIQSCSLVCQEWLDASSFARSQVSLKEGPQILALPRLLAPFTRVQVLHIKASSEASPGASLDDAGMELIARCCRGLVELHLEKCSAFSDAGLAVVLRGCSELRSLEVFFCEGVTGEGLRGFTCSVEKLELSSDNLTNEGLVAAVTACPALKDLSVLSDVDGSLDEGLRTVAKSCSNLVRLKVHAGSMSDETLRCFSTSCRSLKDVNISCQDCHTEEGLAAFFRQLTGLEAVTLDNNLPFSKVPHFGPKLKSLSIGHCWDAEDDAFQRIADFTMLEELKLFRNPHLYDVGVAKILAGCSNLKRLTLEGNVSLTLQTAHAFARGSSKASLFIQDSPDVQREHLSEELLNFDRLLVLDTCKPAARNEPFNLFNVPQNL